MPRKQAESMPSGWQISLNERLNFQVDTYFPFTHPSYELEVKLNDVWLEILGCGIVRQEILRNAGIQEKVRAPLFLLFFLFCRSFSKWILTGLDPSQTGFRIYSYLTGRLGIWHWIGTRGHAVLRYRGYKSFLERGSGFPRTVQFRRPLQTNSFPVDFNASIMLCGFVVLDTERIRTERLLRRG